MRKKGKRFSEPGLKIYKYTSPFPPFVADITWDHSTPFSSVHCSLTLLCIFCSSKQYANPTCSSCPFWHGYGHSYTSECRSWRGGGSSSHATSRQLWDSLLIRRGLPSPRYSRLQAMPKRLMPLVIRPTGCSHSLVNGWACSYELVHQCEALRQCDEHSIRFTSSPVSDSVGEDFMRES